MLGKLYLGLSNDHFIICDFKHCIYVGYLCFRAGLEKTRTKLKLYRTHLSQYRINIF